MTYHEFTVDGRPRRMRSLDDYIRRGLMRLRQESRVVPRRMKERQRWQGQWRVS